MRVLLPLHGFVRWNGGLDLIRLLVSALDSMAVREIELSFAVPVDSTPSRLMHAGFRKFRQFVARSTGGSPAGSRDALVQAALRMIGDRPVVRCTDSSKGVVVAARATRSDFVFPSMNPLGRDGPPRVAYLFDFQHRYLPHLFSARTRYNRDRRFKALAADATGIVVNSRAVADDVVRFLGFPSSKILAMPFSPYALPRWFDTRPEDARRKYGISGRYLLVCNHFWKHKDHATALRAFARLRERTPFSDLQLVMTGDPIDHRDPRHYARLQELARSLAVFDCAHFLGLIPKDDQLALMRGCEVLLQPTHFEGGPGGGSVYEAVGLGVPAVVSDIPINLEIDQGEVCFFRKGDAEHLAESVAELLSSPRPRPTREELLAKGDANLQRLGNVICRYLTGLHTG